MALVEDVQEAIKSNKVIFGYNESLSYIKTNEPKLIVLSNNLPVNMERRIVHNAKVVETKLERFDGTSRELGVICGRPFSISTLVIKG